MMALAVLGLSVGDGGFDVEFVDVACFEPNGDDLLLHQCFELCQAPLGEVVGDGQCLCGLAITAPSAMAIGILIMPVPGMPTIYGVFEYIGA